MNTYHYHLVDARARKLIDLRDYELEIKRAFRFVPFLFHSIKAYADHFEFLTYKPLTATDARQMGRCIAKSAHKLAAMAVKVYEAEVGSGRGKSTQLFKKFEMAY